MFQNKLRIFNLDLKGSKNFVCLIYSYAAISQLSKENTSIEVNKIGTFVKNLITSHGLPLVAMDIINLISSDNYQFRMTK